jgi:hypothetical protein
MKGFRVVVLATVAAMSVAGCDNGDGGTGPGNGNEPVELVVQGQGIVPDRFTAELWVQGNTAYTSTWGARVQNGILARGDAVKIWDVSALAPVLVDSVIVPGATTLGDLQTTPDGRYLVVATETVGSMVIYDLLNPRKPVLVTRFQNADIEPGVHTAEVQSVGGKVYAFLSIDPRGGNAARLVIVDITNPAAPVMVFSRIMGAPFVHDVFVRDGILMTALWNDGLGIFDIGGGGKGGTVANPVQLSVTQSVGGKVHNIFWYRDPVGGSKRYAIIGEEGPGSVPTSSIGDIHVMDVSDMTAPREVAFFNVPGAGVHNFSVDEDRGILYAAYYNAGVRALNIRGDLGTCSASEKSADGRCDLAKMKREAGRGLSSVTFPVYVWGVHFVGGKLYASDMINGLWRLSTVPAS